MDQEALKKILSYSKETGLFHWKVQNSRRVQVGDVAGGTNLSGYIVIGIGGKTYYAHRLAWLYVTGEWPKQIDHRNGKHSDNRWINLREATHQQNVFNAKLAKNNSSGFKGVTWHKAAKKWSASVYADGKKKHLGLFLTSEDAHYAYVNAVKQIQPEFVRSK